MDTSEELMEMDSSESDSVRAMFRPSLGFIPQKPTEYDAHLPYVEKLDQESNLMLAEIKGNLGKAVQLRDLKVGVRHWIHQLDRYISLYEFKFSKEDHILFVKLLFELLSMPTQEFSLVEKAAKLITTLLRKKNCLDRDDLVLPWKPLYKILKNCFDENCTWTVYSARFENVMKSAILSCSHYFHEDATQEMLDEWRPWLCPLDTMAILALSFMEVFLPCTLPTQLHHKGFKLWLDELLQLWHSFHSAPSWEGSLVSLFSRLAHSNVGYIDWTPHIPMIFTRLLRSFCLPVGNHQIVPSRSSNNVYDISNMALWIVGTMGGPNNTVQEHLDKLFKALHSFYHPSNIGKWTIKLGSFLHKLPKHFVHRLKRERIKELKYLPPIPSSHKMTDVQVTEFVECMKSSVFVAMFSKFGSNDASYAIRSLAQLRPEIMIPPLLEKMYPAMETLIEPHRLIACMICIVPAARPMMSSQHYPEGRSHVLPLLNLALPGIDPNDFRKTLVTLQMIATFVSMVPIVDVSDAYLVYPDLTEHERELCSATAQFEDFVISLLDRIENLIENSSQDMSFANLERVNPEQTYLEMGLGSTVSMLLQQCSTPIYMSALKKIHRFATTSVFEVKVSGKLAAIVCRACAKVKPEVALKMFIPKICSSIQTFLTEHPGAVDEENLDDSLLWDLLLLSQVVRCDGSKLLAYKDSLLDVLHLTLKLKCVTGYTLASTAGKHILNSLVSTYPLDFSSLPFELDQPIEKYLPIKDWGKHSELGDVKWHVPSDDEMEMARNIFDDFLIPQLDAFMEASAERKIDKDDLFRRLTVVLNLFNGASSVLPTWEGESYKLLESQVPLSRFSVSVAVKEQEITVKGKNAREAIHNSLSHLIGYISESQEDDTKGLFGVIKIFESLLFDHGTIKTEFDTRWKSYHLVKNALKTVLQKEKKHSRTLKVDRIQLQHELRNINRSNRFFTARHESMVKELLQLSISRYREVRKKAQACLNQTFRSFMFSYRTCVSPLAENLWNKELPEHVFKGSLYTICMGSSNTCIASRVSWETLHKLWPALTQAQHSEKPSVLKVIDDIINRIFKSLETFAICFETTQPVIKAGENLLSSQSQPTACDYQPSPQELEGGQLFEQQINESTKWHYNSLITELINLVENGDLMWKFKKIGLELLSMSLHEEVKPSPQMVDVYMKHCVHDMLYLRKMSFNTLSTIMEQLKTPFVKVPVDVERASGVSPIDNASLIPGDRPDNAWLKFDPAKMIETEAEWNSTVFVEKTHWGYYCWPKELKTYAPANQQPDMNRPVQELNASELPIHNYLGKEDYVAKMVDLLALEEEKNTDKFRISVYHFFKILFRNFGDSFLEQFKPHVERLIHDTGHETRATNQRCGMEILSGIITGSKMWSFEKSKKLWQWICPLLEQAMNNLSVETLSDWGTFFLQICGNRDPRKLQWLFALMLKNPLNGEGGAFGDSGRLYALQHLVLQQEWRIPAYLHAVVDYLRPQMAHTYKSVRDRMGTLLSTLHQLDYQVHPSSKTESPQRADLLRWVLPQLEQFRDVILAHNNKAEESATGNEETPMEGVESTDQGDEDKKEAVRLCKTVVRWVYMSFAKSMSAIPVELFQLLPILENLQTEAYDEDLRKDCNSVMLELAQVLLPSHIIPQVLATIKEVSKLKSWRARAGILTYMQQLVFGNFFLVQETPMRQAVQSMLLHLLCDEQLEVREMAAVTLSGMIHCGYLEMDKEMRAHFERLRSTKVKVSKGNKAASSQETVSLQSLIQRHAGVLGLSAYIQAYPYDVPEFIPQVLMDLSFHVNDPQPIGTTVTKTLSSFRHTHHDSWHDHKRMFTDDQLVTLTDLLISPNYYA